MTTIDITCLDGEIEGAVNFRDLGGYRAGELRVRRGVLYRSGQTHSIGEEGLRTLGGRYGVRTVIDLRSEREVREGTAPWWDAGITHLHLPVFADIENRPQVQEMRERFAQMRAGEYDWGASYVEMAREGASTYRAMFDTLAREDTLPALFHCAGGRDRTGVAAALILTSLGVSREDAADDYALTGRYLRPHAGFFTAQVARFGLTAEEMVEAVLETRAEAMLAFLAALDAEHGSVEGYLRGIGVDDATLAELRSRLLEPAE